MTNDKDNQKAGLLSAFITWLDVWAFYRHDTMIFTQEALSAPRLSAQSLLAPVKHCICELHFKYVPLGKVQADLLESLFGQYRQMAGGSTTYLFVSFAKERAGFAFKMPFQR
ncbi:hypothetical protein HPB50_018748 [Hyalomma asiaticum]|uniref:Uncharacterized protein n=1 Tax=Hyalomma asiaticum TaxID=266040 RepID=A0ACB7S0I7_HYAAI|nr:hypothetical protein HPB50_018748 [Hyalomma asiaticum]